MVRISSGRRWSGFWAIGCLLACAGCTTTKDPAVLESIPHELTQMPLPPYIIEPPDVLVLNAVRLVPKPPYRILPLDALGIQVKGTLPEEPIAGVYGVEADGTVNLGFTYGLIKLEGMTLPEAKKAIEAHLKPKLKPPYEVTVVLAETRTLQQIRGPHLVHPDGTVSLGIYGSVFVDNLSIPDAKAAIEAHLSKYLVKPEISVDIAGFNSKVFYVITDGAGSGAQVVRLPVTGKLTVLDALSQVNGLAPVSSKCVYLVRPATRESCSELVLKVKWHEIARRGISDTNYQVFPGDRIFIVGDPLITIDVYLARIISPIERLFGITLLGQTTVNEFKTGGSTTITTTR
jgi:protein involved in polysaccharide export with SLBB domain